MLELAWLIAHGVRDRFLFDPFGLDNAGGPHRYANRAILLEYPIEHVVVVACNRCCSQYEFAARTSADHIAFEMPPRWVIGRVFKEAGELRLQHRCSRIRRHETGKVLRVCRAIIRADRLDQTAEKKLAGIYKCARTP